ncbi:MAG: hypothetical protein ACYTGZ_18145 [Planctomycetota bacterium]|jgi:hypothetical protein
MTRSLTMAHLGAVFVLLSVFLPVVGAPLVTAIQRESASLPAGFSMFDLARLQGVGSISWHALIVLSVGGIAALMAFTGPHRGLWVPAGIWLVGIAVELRILIRDVTALNGDAPTDSILRASIAPWGWAAAAMGAVLLVVAGIAAHRSPS